MNGNGSDQPATRDRSTSLWGACIALSLTTLLVLPIFAGVGYWRSDMLGVQSAAVAAAICWVGAMLALLLGGLMRGTKQAVNGVLLGMFFRLGVPLGAGLALYRQGGELAEAGVFGMILAFYFVTLFVETLLAVRLIRPSGYGNNATKAS